jgi:flagellar M-ring protein FliF
MKKSQLITIIAIIIGTVVALSVVASFATQVNYAVLFSGMSESDAGDVYNVLEGMGVNVKAGGNGTILVPKEQVDQLRYQLNAQGYPKSGLNYDIYTNNATSFGMTDSDKELYYKFQLEQNISQTINRMDKIKSSTVMITLADDSQYVLSEKGSTAATASVVLELKDGATLSTSDADTVRAIVSKSVKDLPPENITIADSKMNVYNEGGNGDDSVNEHLALQTQVAEQLRKQILNLLTPVFGAEKLSASVNVVLNFDKSTTNSITLSPPVDNGENTGIIVSMKDMEEKVSGSADTAGQPGQTENGGGAPTYQEDDPNAQEGDYSNVTREINYEVNQINEQLEKAQGTIQDLSATVIIDGGDEVKALLPDIKNQIATAVGVPSEKITVANMSFAQNTQYQETLTQQQEAIDKMARSQMLQTVIIAGALVAIALIIIGVINKNRKRKQQMEADLQALQFNAEAAGARGVNVVADEEISIEELMEREKNNTLGQLQGLVEKDSEMIAQLLRNWLTDDYRR